VNVKIKIACVLCFVFLSGKAGLLAQTDPHDTVLLNKYNDLCNKYELENADSLLKYASIQLILANKNNLIHHQVHAYTNLGVAYTRLFQFNEALNCYLSARDLVEKNHRTGISALLGQIGYIYLRLNRKKEAYKYFKQQEAASLKEQNYQSYLSCIVNLADYFNVKNQLDSTIEILHKGLIIARKYKYHDNEVIILDNIANVYYAKAIDTDNKYLFKLSQLYADTALAHHYRDKDSSAIYYIYGLLGALNMDMGNYAKSENYYNQYISYSKRTQDIINLKIGMDECSHLFAVQGKFDLAYRYRIMYDSINKLYIDEEANKQVEELNTKYETEKKEQQNQLLTVSNEKKQLGIYFALGACGLLGGLVLLIFRSYRQKQKANVLISKQKEEVEKQKGEIGVQKEIIEEKQKEILDSIHYAKRIQTAVITSDEYLLKHLNDFFVMYQPKDIVSGDFYWAVSADSTQGAVGNESAPLLTAKRQLFYLAVCDSTGHGVPGAFMSLLNIGFLREAINERHIEKPNEVFDYVRRRLVETVSKEEQQDGFDGVLLCIDKQTGSITYAAAHNGPLIISENKLQALPYDKMPVGKGERDMPFTLYSVNVKPHDRLYLFTDGYADQFGGPKGKKLKYKQLEEILLRSSAMPVKEQSTYLATQFDAWKGNLEQVDDVLIIGIEI
jgi:serine phosphatase RsbU (regulator of sigma subunit)